MKNFRYLVVALAMPVVFPSAAWAQDRSHSATQSHAHHGAHMEWTRGKIVKMDAETANVTLKHQRIKSIGMEAMTMPFKVADAATLGKFKVGDSVRFTVKEQGDRLFIDAMEKAK
ncbi:MAG: copper-binding protein [Cytophagales bacterium]|nr:copper-binding protein [Cytophagales bacterium]